MTMLHKAWLVLAILALIAYATVNRYEINQPPEKIYTVRLDRWTGAVCVLFPTSTEDTQPMPAKCTR